MSDNQESVSREHMRKMIRAQTVVMKQVHEENLALQQENAELREILEMLINPENCKKDIIHIIGSAENLLNKND